MEMASAPSMQSAADMVGQSSAQPYASAPTPMPQPAYSSVKPDTSVPQEVSQASPDDLARLVRNWMSEK